MTSPSPRPNEPGVAVERILTRWDGSQLVPVKDALGAAPSRAGGKAEKYL